MILFCSMIAMGQTPHIHTNICEHKKSNNCYTTLLNMFMDGMNISKKQAQETIANLTQKASIRSIAGDSTFFGGIFYYPNAPADAGLTISEFESKIKDVFETGMQEYLSSLSISIHYKVNYIGVMEYFSETDFSNKIFALSATGQGNYVWAKSRKSEYHLSSLSFILPLGHHVNSTGDQADGWATVLSNSQQNENLYIQSFYPNIIIDDIKSVITHEFGHNCGVNHQLSEGSLGGDPNGYAFFLAGEIGTANMLPYVEGITVNIPSSPEITINGIVVGSEQENSRSVIEGEMPFLTGIFEETCISANDTTVNQGDIIQLNIATNGDEIAYEVISGDISISDNNITVNSSGTVVVSAKQNDGSVYWVHDTVNITANTILQAPSALCKNLSIALDENGQAKVAGSDIDNGSSDSDGNIVSRTIDSKDAVTFSCDDIGQKTVTLTVTDNDGLSATCSSVISIVDDIVPILECVTDVSLKLDADQDTTLDINSLITKVDDNCNYTLNQPLLDFSGSSPGAYNRVIEATDASGNTGSCTVNITVETSTSVINIADDARITVYPNPTKGMIYIKTDGTLDIKAIYITDMMGNKTQATHMTHISVEQLPAGTFFLEIMTADEVFKQKLIKM